MDLIQQLLSQSTRITCNNAGMTALDSLVSHCWHLPQCINIFDYLIEQGAELGPHHEHFANILTAVLKKAPTELDGSEDTYRSRAAVFLCSLLRVSSTARNTASGRPGQIAAIWAVHNGLSDLLDALVAIGINATERILEVSPMSVVENLVCVYHPAKLVQKVFDIMEPTQLLQVNPATEYGLLHLLCDGTSCAEPDIIFILLARGLHVDVVGGSSRVAPLMLAVYSGKLEHTKLLLKEGASLHATDADGWNVLHHASSQSEILSFLSQNYEDELCWRSRAPGVTFFNTITFKNCNHLHLAVLSADATSTLLEIMPEADADVRTESMETPLHIASAVGSYETAFLLVESGASLDALTQRHETPLHVAVIYDNFAIVRLLSEHGSDINATTTTGRTPLHYAAEYGYHGITEYLLEAGAVSRRDEDWMTPDLLAASKNHAWVAELIQDHFDSVNGKYGTIHDKSRKDYSVSGHVPDEGSLVVNNGAGSKIFTTILKAAACANETLIEGLLLLDTQKGSFFCPGCSPILIALHAYDVPLARTFINNGYSIQPEGCHEANLPQFNAVQVAARQDGASDVLELLLSRMHANDNLAGFAIPAVHIAVALGNLPGLIMLLDRHEATMSLSGTRFNVDDLRIKDAPRTHVLDDPTLLEIIDWGEFYCGYTALHVAATFDNCRAVQALLDRGASIESLTEGSLFTPLHCAASRNSLNAIKLLLEKGANLEARSHIGNTPLLEAALCDQSSAVQYLHDRGASLSWTDLAFDARRAATNDRICLALAISEELPRLLSSQVSRLLPSSPWEGCLSSLKLSSKPLLLAWLNTPGCGIGRHIFLQSNRGLRGMLKWLRNHNLLAAQLNEQYPPPLCFAVQDGNPQVVTALLEAGGDVDAPGCEEGPPLTLACIINRLEIVKVLVRAGAAIWYTKADGSETCCLESAFRYKRLQEWLLVGRWTEQQRLAAHAHTANVKTKPWSGLHEVWRPLEHVYKQRHGETLLQWHIRKKKQLKWFEGRVLHYGPDTEYVFAD